MRKSRTKAASKAQIVENDIFAHLGGSKRDVDDKWGTGGAEPWEAAAVTPDDMKGRFKDAEAALRFMRAGKATVTLVSRRTGTRFTYRLRESDDKMCLFVGLLTGANNETDYSYLGRVSRDIFWAGRKVPKAGDIGKDAESSRAFAWTWRQLVSGAIPEALEVWHEGRCGRCGRKLTVPTSVAAGFGPECSGKM